MTKTPGSGRKKGTPNQKTADLREKLDRMECDPREIMALIALNKLPCGVCRGKGRTPYILPVKPFKKCQHCGHNHKDWVQLCRHCGFEPERKFSLRDCQSCHRTLLEACSPNLRGQMSSELLQYLYPKRKAVEVTGEGGGPVEHRVRVVYDPVPQR